MSAAGIEEYGNRRIALQNVLRDGVAGIGLRKSTSNLFRRRRRRPHAVDVRGFDHVLDVRPAEGLVVAEGMATFDSLVRATLPFGFLPAVVPELKTITLGGALAGIGVEATSFRQGLVHDAVTSFDVVTGDGRILECSPHEHADLFFGLPNSYGTLGYALRIEMKMIPAAPRVRIRRERFADAGAFFRRLAEIAESPQTDFLDGVVFGRHELVINDAAFTDETGPLSDYTGQKIYYRSIRDRDVDLMRTADYVWRWDADWFWCSRFFGMEHPFLRRLLGRWMLNSYSYWRLKRLAERLGRSPPPGHESVVVDIGVPMERAAIFLEFCLDAVGITPIWICPFRPRRTSPLFPVEPGRLYVDVAFWDSLPSRGSGYINRLIEERTEAEGGVKSLYSRSFYDRPTFDRLYGGEVYRLLKERYDPAGAMGEMFEKCVVA